MTPIVADHGAGRNNASRRFPSDVATIECHMLTHPAVLRPTDHAEWRSDKMGKSTIYQSARLLVGLNAFEPGQSHALHAHVSMDKMYYVLDGDGIFLLEGREMPMQAGDLLVVPDGVPHGVKNTGKGRLLVLAVLAPAP
jgi:quercetin dioxygenase-like cupin family protein